MRGVTSFLNPGGTANPSLQLLGLELGETPADSDFLDLLERVDLKSMVAMLRQWILPHFTMQDNKLDQLICDCKTFHGSPIQHEWSDGDNHFVTKITPYGS
jgi:hypothetical protein